MMPEKYTERDFIVFLSPNTFITIRAQHVDCGSNTVYFHRVINTGRDMWQYEPVASFLYENICGWSEKKHVKEKTA